MSKTTAPAPEAPAAETTTSPKGLMSKLKIVGIIVGIMVAELVAILMVMPSSSHGDSPAAAAEAAADGEHEHAEDGDSHDAHGKADAHGKGDAGGHGAASKDAKAHGKKDDHGGHGAPAAPVKSGNASEELDLGLFSVTSYQPASNTTLFISFHLFGTLLHKNNEELTRRLDDNKHRVRDNIIVIIRSAEITDLTDAGLGLIKRRILETINKTLGKPLLQAVVFSEFSFVEQ